MLKEVGLSFPLPLPWRDKLFDLPRVGAINYLVGPNGSGKSRFAEVLKLQLPSCRLLGTDRLKGLERYPGMQMYGDWFSHGLPKDQFQNFRNVGQNFGFGIDALVLLAEKLDLRVRIESTLSHLFNRQIVLEWDSGNLIPRAFLGADTQGYRIDSDECHGIRELLVLLTHLYNDDSRFLIIDEPELHLHPQFQAFFVQEVRRVSGDPDAQNGRKIIFLITHSPFILDFKELDELRAVISFDLEHSLPKSLLSLDDAAARHIPMISRLNVHHKQLFFSDNPIFVEGVLDAELIGSIQNQRGVSMASTGSCLIDSGGAEEVNKYLHLCRHLGKFAHFLYDLDALYTGTLRSSIRADEAVSDFLADLGLGNDFAAYCGELDRRLTRLIETVRAAPAPPPDALEGFPVILQHSPHA